MKVSKITDKIILLSTSSQKQITDTVMRFQEYYESPIPEIRGQIFTIGYFKSLYSQNKDSSSGAFTYISGHTYKGDWNGFNFPGHVLQPFIQGLFDPLTKEERDVIELFRYRTDKFYIIGLHRENNGEDVLNHEIAHGLFYTDTEYNQSVTDILKQYDLCGFKKMLKSWGYCADEVILNDECQAYIGCDYQWMIKDKQDDFLTFGIDIKKLEPLHDAIWKIFKNMNPRESK